MTWALSIILGWLPDLWILAAAAGAALWIYSWAAPGRLSAEAVRYGALGALGAALYLHTVASTTTAVEAQVQAAVEAEKKRVEGLNQQALDDARKAADEAGAARADAEGRLADALAKIPDARPDEADKPHGGGLSPASVDALIKIIGDQ